ncbi:serendipity locus protein beta-like [Culex pipiens pallens]|uniref:serendipity locus protein beta-like n=1 Tax=Culex pipiens pallens TaxID=42434 RepID=UPI001953C121|nr:serendipity locus protein beta-like [Culex pipiens pallens]
MATANKKCNFCADKKQPTTDVSEMTPLFQSVLAKHFWFQESELLTFQMCSACSLKVMDFHLFYSNVEKLHAEKCLEEVPEESEDVVVKDEPLESELDAEQNLYGEGGEQLIVGDLAFEIVDVGTKAEPFEEVNIKPEEVKQEEVEEPESLLISNNNDTMTFDCLNCDKGFEDKKIMELHMKIVHGDGSNAQTCPKCAQLEEVLRDVLEQGHAEVSKSSCPVQCAVCDGRLQNMASLQRHLAWHWGEACGKCRKKPKNFKPKPGNNNEPAKDTPQAKAFMCPYCDKDYGHINFLKHHLKTYHENTPPDGCQRCKALEQALKDVSEQDHSEGSGRVQCGVCNDWLMSVASLQRHLAWHQSEPCENCRRGRRVVEAALKQHVNAQKVHKVKRMATDATSQAAKRTKSDEVSIKHICVYCGLCFDIYAELVKHQVDEHPRQRHCKYTSITSN